MGYHHFRQLLYYPMLNPLERHEQHHQHLQFYSNDGYARSCKEHAIAVSDIVNLAFQTRGCDLVYFLTGHILVVSSSIHLHTLLTGENKMDADMARERLVSNFEILMQLKMYWPVIDSSVTRLRAFQNSCHMSLSDSFILDNWMLKFLMGHTANLDYSSRPVPQYQPTPTTPAHEELLGSAALKAMDTTLSKSRLGTLLLDKDMSNETVVENALSWLLDQDLPVSNYWSTSYQI